MEISWKKYIDTTSDRPPRALLVEAVTYVQTKKRALDLGAGALMDSKYLLQENFKNVTAIDADQASLEKSKTVTTRNFEFIKINFEEYSFPSNTFDLINAQRSLPYLPPEVFYTIFENIKSSLVKGGIFVGQLFGDKDESILPGAEMTRLTIEQVNNLFEELEIIKFKSVEEDKASTLGKLKHFHEFEFIVRKQ